MTVAGLDPSGGAGVLADIKTISAFGCYGVAAITSVTFQNTQRVIGASHLGPEILRQQMRPLFDDFDIAAIKTGMLPTSEIIREVAALIAARAIPVVVVDPVLRSTSGFDLIDSDAVRELKDSLFPLASLVTPNLAEAQRITGIDTRDQPGVERAAELIKKLGPAAVLVTGGDASSDTATDFLLDPQGQAVFSSARISSTNTHGTGCALASAVACLLALGRPLREAVAEAREYLRKAILNAPGLGRGNGPINHFPGR
jgi:hydroxymethylpyrimidine kinase/phosphomethylpyrimidine kinase